MKKLDYLIVSIVFIIGLLLVISFYVYNKSNSDDFIIQIEYRNETIYEINLTEVNEATIFITSTNSDIILELVVDDKIVQTKTFKDKKIINELNYEIILVSTEVKVLKSNCLNHYCMNMELNKIVKSPIICTDGLVVKNKSNLDIDIITGE